MTSLSSDHTEKQETVQLLTFNSEVCTVIVSPMSGMLMTAWQVYLAPCEVLRKLNERFLSLVVPLTATVSLSITLLSPSLPPLQVTVSSASGERWATVVTVQVNSLMSPTLPVAGPETTTSGSGRSVERDDAYIMHY